MTCKELNAYARLSHGVVSTRGSRLVLEDGREVLDLYGGHCVNTLGAGDAAIGVRYLVEAGVWRIFVFAILSTIGAIAAELMGAETDLK